MRYVGIDSGKRGAIVTLAPGGGVKKAVIPLLKNGHIDLKSLCRIINGLKGCCVALEEIHSIYGTSKGSMFTMGKVLGNIEAALICNGLDFEYVKPYDWQRGVWKDVDMVFKSPDKRGRIRTDTKPTSLNAAKRLYPNIDLRYGDEEKARTGRWARKKDHDGLVDALLIAHYLKTK